MECELIDESENESDDETECQYDQSVYDILEFAQAGFPCLSFDFLQGRYNNSQQAAPYSWYFVGGSQSNSNKNQLTLMKLCNVQTEDEPQFEHVALPHLGTCNRIRCTDFNSGDESLRDMPFAATWSDVGNVYIWDLSKPLEAIDNPHAMSHFVRNSRHIQPLFVHDDHETEGFALDWSITHKGHLLTGDCDGVICLLTMASSETWKVSQKYRWHTKSVEDVQWSPSESSVFASSSVDCTIAIWDVRITAKWQLNIPQAHTADVNVISWNRHDTSLLASGGDDCRIRIWDLRMLSQNKTSMVASFSYHKKPITSIEWNPNESSILAASSEDNEVSIWDLAVEKVDMADEQSDSTPDQLMFNHEGLKGIKEIKWHKGVKNLLGVTYEDGFCFFKPNNI